MVMVNNTKLMDMPAGGNFTINGEITKDIKLMSPYAFVGGATTGTFALVLQGEKIMSFLEQQ